MNPRPETRDPRFGKPPLTHPSPLRGEGRGEGVQGFGSRVSGPGSRKVCLIFKISLSLIFIVVSLSIHGCTPRGFDAELRKAESRVGAGDVDGALNAYRAIAMRYKDDPRRPGVLLRIADLYATLVGDDALTIEGYGKVIREYPLSEAAVVARERRAHIFEKKGDFNSAIEDYSDLIKHFPDSTDRHRYRVLLVGAYLAQRNFTQARLDVKELIESKDIPPTIREQALFAAAESFFLEDRSEKAIPFYDALLAEFPDSSLASEARLHLATCIEEMGYLGPARDITKRAGLDYPNQKVIDTRLKSIEERGTKPVDGPVDSHVDKK